MFVMVPENDRFVLAGIAFSLMQSAILLFVFQWRADDLAVRGDVVPNGEVVAVLPAADAPEVFVLPELEDVAMSKMPLLALSFEDVLPEDGDDSKFLPDALFCPVRFCCAASVPAARNNPAAIAKTILMIPFLSVQARLFRKCRARYVITIKVSRKQGKASRFPEKT